MVLPELSAKKKSIPENRTLQDWAIPAYSAQKIQRRKRWGNFLKE